MCPFRNTAIPSSSFNKIKPKTQGGSGSDVSGSSSDEELAKATKNNWVSLKTRGNDNDNDHSSSQLTGHKALTYPKGQSAWALPLSLFGELLASCGKNLSACSCATLVTRGMKWTCTCCWKWWCDQLNLERVAEALCVVFVGWVSVVLVFLRTNFRSVGRG